MQVDDKLAKDKLIMALGLLACPDLIPPYRAGPGYEYFQKAIAAIRNTDLTDCQPQQPMENMSGTQAGNDPSATPSGTPELLILANRLVDFITQWPSGVEATGWDGKTWFEHRLEYVAARSKQCVTKGIGGLGESSSRWLLAKAEETVQLANDPKADAVSFWRARARYFAEELLRADLMATGTDSTRSGDQINPDGVAAPDQGSVRNATDMRERCAQVVESHMGPIELYNPGYRKIMAIAHAIRALDIKCGGEIKPTASEAALRELIACKDLKDRIIGLVDPAVPDTEELTALNAEYERRQPLAWKAARAAIRALPVLEDKKD